MKKVIIIFLVLFPVVCFAWTPQTALIGPADGNSDQPTTDLDNLGTNGQDRATQWKIFRWEANASGDIYVFSVRMDNYTSIGAMSTDVDLAYAVFTDDPTDPSYPIPGSLKVWGYTNGVNFYAGENGNCGGVAKRFCFDVQNVVTNRTVTAGQFYWIAFRSTLGLNSEDGSTTYFERGNGSETPYASWIQKCIGPQTADPNDMSETPYSSWSDSICGEDNSVNDNIYGWSAWTASDAGPAVTSTSGTWTHGSTNAVIGGYSFGTKSPVAPLMWDNGEDSTVDSDAAVTGTAGSKTRGLHNPWPPPSTASVAACRLRYRDAPYRSIAAPHTRSSQYLAGCHYQFADNNPQYISAEDVGQVDNQYRAVGACGLADADSSNWYMHFYYRIDDTWSIEGSSGLQPNHKMTTWGNDSPWGMYDSVGVNYTVYCGGLSPETETGDTTRLSLADSNNNSLGNCTSAPYGNNPNDRWIKIEEMLSATSRDLWIDNTHAIQTATVANTRSACFGGYFRYTVGPEAQYNPNYRGGVLDSNYRYFDDIYIDITRARVMLCNVSTYPTTDAGVCEPQIPHTTWNDTTIQITVNQGALSAGTNYLFVFDSDNTANTTGYPVTLGSITTPPSAKGLIMKGATWK